MPDRQFPRFLADVLTFGWVLPAAIAIGAGLGWLLDRLLGTFPVLVVAFGLLGFAAGIWQLWREMEALSARGKSDDEKPPEKGGTP